MKRIAVRCPNWVGDTVMATPVLAALRAHEPDAEITAIARPYARGVLENNPHINNLWLMDDHGLQNLMALRKKIRAQRFDAALLLPGSVRSVLPFALAGVKKRVGYARDSRSLLLTHPVKVTKYHADCHQVMFYLDLLKEFGIETIEENLKQLVLVPTDASRQQAEEVIKQEGLAGHKLIVALCPGAAYGSAKCWLPERFARLADLLITRYDAEVLLLGAPSEAKLCAEIAELCSNPVHNRCLDVDLPTLIALCERISVFVTNDCGSMHIAAAMKTPLVAIFGPTDPKNTSPWTAEGRVVEDIEGCGCDLAPCYKRVCPIDHRCMKAVTVPDVAAAVEWHVARMKDRK